MPLTGLRRAITVATFSIALTAFASTYAHSQAQNTPEHKSADLVLYNGNIVTVERSQPQAQALAVVGNRIVAVGSDAQIKPWIGPQTRAIDLHGMTAIPGLMDSHAHFLGTGESLSELDVSARQAPTWGAVVARVAAAVKRAKPGEWIIGNGWHQNHWTHPPQPNFEGLPTGKELDAVSPDNPVLLVHASGHAVFVNQKALELAGIGPNTPNPAGGEIVRDENGRAIGMLRDKAMGLVYAVLQKSRANKTPAEKEKQLLREVNLATQDALEHGVTTWQDMGESFAEIDSLKQLADEGKLHIRLYAWINGESVDALKAHLKDYYLVRYGKYGHLTVRGIGEILSDGALGTHSAWFFHPYVDVPSTTGYNVTPMDQIRAIAEVAIADGFQVSVHAIGTRANHETLNVYQEVMAEHPGATDLRWRIDHAQHLLASDIPRFHALHVIASMQTGHACDDAPYVVQRIGEVRAAYSYPWHSLISDRAIIANGTDAPVIPIDTMPNFFCAVTRQERFDPSQPAFYPFQAMTRMEALRSYTYNGAYSMFEESELGSLAPRKLADIVVLDGDIMTESPAKILKTNVVYTILDGKIAYHRGHAGSAE
jgi:predicted amidohydrolase YtcJ